MIVATPSLILIMFLPALIELKKPKDEGPRVIPNMNMSMTYFIPIANIEEEQKFDSSLIQTIAKIIMVLPSVEV